MINHGYTVHVHYHEKVKAKQARGSNSPAALECLYHTFPVYTSHCGKNKSESTKEDILFLLKTSTISLLQSSTRS